MFVSERPEQVSDLLRRGVREGCRTWVAPHGLVVHSHDQVGASALQHQLSQEDGPRIARSSPRKLPSAFAIPAKQPPPQRRKARVRRVFMKGLAHSHGDER